jgi:hypothetical protein
MHTLCNNGGPSWLPTVPYQPFNTCSKRSEIAIWIGCLRLFIPIRAEYTLCELAARERCLVGRDSVKRFFEKILRNLTITTFHTGEFLTENDTVVVIGFESGTVKATGIHSEANVYKSMSSKTA